jgi:nitrite reductase (NADH) small subunit
MTAPVWQVVCRLDDLVPERGVAALLGAGPDATQVALVRLPDDTVLAVDNHDPFGDAYVMSRGIVGSRRVGEDDVPTIASPLYKQVFDLRTGQCLDEAGKPPARGYGPHLRSFPVRVSEGTVSVDLEGAPSTPAAVAPSGLAPQALAGPA